jgi:hypothetical protein
MIEAECFEIPRLKRRCSDFLTTSMFSSTQKEIYSRQVLHNRVQSRWHNVCGNFG